MLMARQGFRLTPQVTLTYYKITYIIYMFLHCQFIHSSELLNLQLAAIDSGVLGNVFERGPRLI